MNKIHFLSDYTFFHLLYTRSISHDQNRPIVIGIFRASITPQGRTYHDIHGRSENISNNLQNSRVLRCSSSCQDTTQFCGRQGGTTEQDKVTRSKECSEPDQVTCREYCTESDQGADSRTIYGRPYITMNFLNTNFTKF